MYRFTLLLIPLILLSSCTIDWNDQKAKKIIELESENSRMESENQDLRNEIETKDNNIEECNSNISEAQGYAGGTYVDMNDALENLQECDTN